MKKYSLQLFFLFCYSTVFSQDLKLMIPQVANTGTSYYNETGTKLISFSLAGYSIWDTKSRRLIYNSPIVSYKDHLFSRTDNGTPIVFSADNRKMGSIHINNIYIWDAENFNILFNIKCFEAQKIVFSPDGNYILVVSNNNVDNNAVVKVYDTNSGKFVSQLNVKKYFSSLLVSSKNLVFTSHVRSVKTWDLISGILLDELFFNEVSFPKPIQDGKRILLQNRDFIKVYDINKKSVLYSIPKKANESFSNMYGISENILWLTSDYKTTQFWNLSIPKLLFVRNSLGVFSAYGTIQNGKKLVYHDWSKNVVLALDLTNGNNQLLYEKKESIRFFNSNMISPDGKKILISENNNLFEYDILLKKDFSFVFNKPYHVNNNFNDSSSNIILTNSTNGASPLLWNVNNGRYVSQLEKAHPFTMNVITSNNILSLSKNKNTIAINSDSNKILVFNYEKNKYVEQVNTEKFISYSLNNDETEFVIIPSDSSMAKIYNIYSKKLVDSVVIPEIKNIYVTSYSPDRHTLGIITSYNKIIFYDLFSRKIYRSINTDINKINSLKFNRDGSHILATSNDSTVYLFEVSTGELKMKLKGMQPNITSATFSTDESKIIGSSGNLVNVWDTKSGELLYSRIAIDSSDYIVFDKYYRYDGTPNAIKLLYFTYRGKIVELSQVKQLLWVPGLVEKIIKGESINAPLLSDKQFLLNNFNVQDQVKIGNQIWMTNNLNVDTFRNGDKIPEAKNSDEWNKANEEGKPAWCYYENLPLYGMKYGKLYNRHAITDPRGLAPDGWRIPTDNDWNTLIKNVGGPKFAVSKLKSKSGWNALDGGIRMWDTNFASLTSAGYWASKSSDVPYSTYDNFSKTYEGIFGLEGVSVRCIKD